MKYTFKLTIVLLIFSLVIPSISGCRSKEVVLNFESLTISGYDISNYKIIYPEPDPEDSKWENYYFGIDYKFDYVTANTLKEKIKQIFGTELEVHSDAQAEASQFEILIGKTNREESRNIATESMLSIEAKCFVVGSKLLLYGGNYASTYSCIDLLIKEFEKCAHAGLSTESLDASFSSLHTFSTMNVAMVGDDIFDQPMSSGDDRFNVQSVLQRMLWKDYTVTSYLEGNSTIRPDYNTGNQYIATNCYKNLIRDCGNLDIIIICLGTYDFIYSENDWDKTDTAVFLSNYINIIKELKNVNEDLKFYICTTVATGDNDNIIEAQRGVFNSLADLDYNVELIELDTLIDRYVYDISFSEGIYPNEFASAIIAKRIAHQINSSENDP